MARNNYHSPVKQRGSSSNKHHKFIFAFIALLVIGVLALIIGNPFSTPQHATQANNSNTQQHINFDFYTILPETQTAQANTQVVLPAPSDQQQFAANLNNGYYLQVASVHNLQQAKALTKKLQGLNYPAQIKQLTSNETTWYRILVGPYAELSQAQQNQQKLAQENHYNSLLIKR